MPLRSTKRGQDAIALLKKDHVKLKGLLRRLQSSKGGDARRNLFEQIEHDLRVHTQIEEEIFYPAFKDAVRSKEQRKLYFESIEEHHVVDLFLPELKESKLSPEVFAAKAKVLRDLVEHHAEEEETQMFPRARTALGSARLKELGAGMQIRKDQLAAGMWDRALGILNPFADARPKERAA